MTEKEKQIVIKQINKGNSLKEFTCPCCDITFTDLYDFRKHLFKKHKTEWNECFQKVQIPMIKQKKEKRELFLTPEQILERKIKSDLKRQIKKMLRESILGHLQHNVCLEVNSCHRIDK